MSASNIRRPVGSRGVTLIEIMVAMFVFLIGVVGVLAALPTGIDSAALVIFQDAAIHLSASKFAEFRRDRIDPAADLQDGSAYMASSQEPKNGSAGGYRDFAHASGQAYEYFSDVERYEWRVVESELTNVGVGTDALGKPAPVEGGGDALPVTRVALDLHLKGTKRNFRFVQYMLNLK
ncbi:MAG: prepilin-type N-terminal cleavage/methylation domain-containing protein [Planctomycetota bacterium]|nr:prepilin-type N-terminal cleavage/methylation domain-containing protein [Planctomycetota bacterium]